MNRHERRKASKGRRKALGTVEIFTMTFAHGREPIHLDVAKMRKWAEANCELVAWPIDPMYVKKLIDDGTVTRKDVMRRTLPQMLKPILVCKRPNSDAVQIVDGNHTYVAQALGWAMGCEQGLSSPDRIPNVPGYELSETEWRPFVVQIIS